MIRHSFKNLFIKPNFLNRSIQCTRHVSLKQSELLKNYISNSGSTLQISNQPKRSFQISSALRYRVFKDTENVYCYNILQENNAIHPTFTVKSINRSINSLEEFDLLLDKHYRVSTIEEIVQAFKDAKSYCIENNINLSDSRFNNLVDGLMDNCEHLTDGLLYELLQCISEYPQCETYDSNNYHDIWNCLDDICCWKMQNWSTDQMFLYADIWYKLSLGRIGDYVFQVINKLADKGKYLTKDQIVRVFFYYNVCRKRSVDFSLEDTVSQCVKEMNVDELAVVALGFFKTKSKVKIPVIIETMMDKVKEGSKTINEISLCAILKVIRLSKHGKLMDKMHEMLDALVPEIDRLSHTTCLHIAIIGTSIQALHSASLLKATEKIGSSITDVSKVRLKDIERLLMALTMFDISEERCCNFYEKAFKELHAERRLPEKVQYNTSMTCSLHFLSLRGIYSYELMNGVLEAEFINEVFGKSAKELPRELFSLDCSIDVECPDYKGNRLPAEKRYKAAKWKTEFIPSYDQYTRITTLDKVFLETVDSLKLIVGGEKFLHQDHILPHFAHADIVLCKDIKQNKFIEPFGFENYILGDVKYPVKKDNLQWYAAVIIGWNTTLRGTTLPLGAMMAKARQLKKIGYQPVFIIWNEFTLLPKEGKVLYIRQKIS